MVFIDKSGAWYSYQQEKIGQGKDNVRTFLKEHPEISKTLEQKIRQEFLINQKKAAVDKPVEELAVDE